MLLALNLAMSFSVVIAFGAGLPLWMLHREKKYGLIREQQEN